MSPLLVGFLPVSERLEDPPPMEDWTSANNPPSWAEIWLPEQAACRFFETYRRLAPVFLDSLPNLLHVSEQQGTGRITTSIWLLRPLSLICTGFEI